MSGVLGNEFYANLLGRWLTNDTYPLRQNLGAIMQELAQPAAVRAGEGADSAVPCASPRRRRGTPRAGDDGAGGGARVC